MIGHVEIMPGLQNVYCIGLCRGKSMIFKLGRGHTNLNIKEYLVIPKVRKKVPKWGQGCVPLVSPSGSILMDNIGTHRVVRVNVLVHMLTLNVQIFNA